MGKVGKVILTILERIGLFIVLLIISPFWVIVGIMCAFSALFGTFDSVDEYEEPEKCPEEVDPNERIRKEISELENNPEAIPGSDGDC